MKDDELPHIHKYWNEAEPRLNQLNLIHISILKVILSVLMYMFDFVEMEYWMMEAMII